MIRRLIALFSASPSGQVDPAPDPLTDLPPMPGTSAFHLRRAHRHGTAVRMTYGRWLSGHECFTPAEIADQAEVAAIEFAVFATRLREEVASVDVPHPEGGDR